jgi:hypothetical protein
MTFKNSNINIDTTSGYTPTYYYNEFISLVDSALIKNTNVNFDDPSPPFNPSRNFPYPVDTTSPAQGNWLGQEGKLALYRDRQDESFWEFYDVPEGYKLSNSVNADYSCVVRSQTAISGWEIKDKHVPYPNQPVSAFSSTLTSLPTFSAGTQVDIGRVFNTDLGVFNPAIVNHSNLNIIPTNSGHRCNSFTWTNNSLPSVPSFLIMRTGIDFRWTTHRFSFTNASSFPFNLRINFDRTGGTPILTNSPTKPFTSGTILPAIPLLGLTDSIECVIPATNSTPYVLLFKTYRTGTTLIISNY